MKKYKYNKSAGGLFNGTKEINTQPNSSVANIYKNNIKNSGINSSNTGSSSTTQELMSKYNSFKKKINLKYVLITILILVILCIIIYIVICYVYYNNIICYEKKPFFDYLFSFSNNEICLVQNKPLPEVPTPLPPVNKFEINLIPKKEVYHIANQDYTYEQAKCKCESYGGELASKAQITDAYNNGANWCTYGWSDKQSAYYPVQKCDWDKLTEENQRLPKHAKKFCGLPGINGGYFPNPSIRFGANCYGIKPKGELNKPKAPYCKPQNFCSLKNNFEASHKLDTDEISPFNSDKWSSQI